MRKRVVETCEMCSAEVNNPTTIKVEGAVLRVCPNCTSFGNIIEDKPPKSSTGKSKLSNQSRTKRKTIKSSKSIRSKKSQSGNDEELLVMDYGNVIKKARMKKKLTQEQLSNLTGVSVAYIRSIESEKMKPTDRVAKKLEQELGIELFEQPDAQLEYSQKSDKKGTTVGDIVTIKRLEFD